MTRGLVEETVLGARRGDLLGAVGRTPLIALRSVTRGLPAGVELYAKAEHLNPGGSVKDRSSRR